MDTNNPWHQRTDPNYRDPLPEEYPVWLAFADGKVSQFVIHDMGWNAVAWQRAIVPAPPVKREMTQGERDAAAWWLWYAIPENTGAVNAWHAALAYERAENRKDLKMLDDATIKQFTYDESVALTNLRRRCGLE